jgi:hypothetical protein
MPAAPLLSAEQAMAADFEARTLVERRVRAES